MLGRMIRNLALLLVATFVSLLLAELAIHVDLVPNTEFVASDSWWKERWHRKKRGANPREFVKLDPDLGWIVAADLDGLEYRDVHINTNSTHMRGTREYPLEPTGAPRVVAVGDSYTFGECAADDETFPAVMEERLGAEVLNLGVMGYGQDQALLRMKRDGLPYRPDAVVFGFHWSDMRRNRLSFRDYGKPRFRLSDAGLVLENVPVPPPESYSPQFWPPRLWNYVESFRDSRRWMEEIDPEIHALSRAIVHRMAEEARAGATELVVVLLPSPHNVMMKGAFGGWAWFQELCQEGEEQGTFRCVDPTPRFREVLPDDEPGIRAHFDCHYSPTLYRAVGEVVAEALSREMPERFALGGRRP